MVVGFITTSGIGVNNISAISRRTALLVEKTRVHRENHQPITDKLYHIMLIN
jgi:hypothetical protein